MSLLHTPDGRFYRRWVNVVASFILLGSAQFLAGRRAAGVSWWLFFILCEAAWVALKLHPKTPWSVLDGGLPDAGLLLVWLVVAGDGLRQPIARMGIRKWACFLLICEGIPLTFALAFRTFVATPFKVPTNAMAPTLKGVRKNAAGEEIPGDHVWVSRLAYRSHGPERGDIVVFKTTGLPMVQQGTYYVKRVVGLPGETVGIDAPYLTVDGKRVTDPPVFRRIAGKKGGFCGYVTAGLHPSKTFSLARPADRVTLGPGQYLVFGDNSTNSFDGRYFGPVPRRAILGRVVGIYAPADRKRMLE
jgi:signal peptidase I